MLQTNEKDEAKGPLVRANSPIRTYLSESRAVVSAFFNFVFPEDDTFLVFW